VKLHRIIQDHPFWQGETACRARAMVDLKREAIDFHLASRWIYEADLDRCRNADEALDWVRQVSQKTWASTQTILQLCSLLMGAKRL
jgi:hypothetical protein